MDPYAIKNPKVRDVIIQSLNVQLTKDGRISPCRICGCSHFFWKKNKAGTSKNQATRLTCEQLRLKTGAKKYCQLCGTNHLYAHPPVQQRGKNKNPNFILDCCLWACDLEAPFKFQGGYLRVRSPVKKTRPSFLKLLDLPSDSPFDKDQLKTKVLEFFNMKAATTNTILPEDQYSSPQDQRSTSEDQYSSPQDQCFTSEDQYSSPQDQPPSEDPCPNPEGQCSASEDQHSSPQDQSPSEDQYSSPQDQCSASEDQYSSPQDQSPSEDPCPNPEDQYSTPEDPSNQHFTPKGQSQNFPPFLSKSQDLRLSVTSPEIPPSTSVGPSAILSCEELDQIFGNFLNNEQSYAEEGLPDNSPTKKIKTEDVFIDDSTFDTNQFLSFESPAEPPQNEHFSSVSIHKD